MAHKNASLPFTQIYRKNSETQTHTHSLKCSTHKLDARLETLSFGHYHQHAYHHHLVHHLIMIIITWWSRRAGKRQEDGGVAVNNGITDLVQTLSLRTICCHIHINPTFFVFIIIPIIIIVSIIISITIVIIMIILIIPTKFDKHLLPEDQICSSKGRMRSKYCLRRNSCWYFVFELLLCILISEKFPSSSPSLSS